MTKNDSMRWIEPQETARARASFWNQPRIMVPSFLYGVTVPFATFGFLTAIAIRLQSDIWDWNNSVLAGTLAGLIFGLVTLFSRYPATRQEIELRSQDFVIFGSSECCTPYDRLRGYSIIQAPMGNAVHRALLLYPKTNGHFSVGLPEDIPDSEIHAILSNQLPFVTILDKQSLNRDTQVAHNSC